MRFLFLLILVLNFLFAEEFPEGWPWNGVTSSAESFHKDHNIVDFMSNNHIKFVRIHINILNTMIDYNVNANDALLLNLKWSKEYSVALKEKNILSIVSIADFPVTKKRCKHKGKLEYWDMEGECVQQIYKFVDISVDFLKGSSIIGYEFLAEPAVRKTLKDRTKRWVQPENWIDIFQNMLQIVRKIDQEKFVVFSLGPWAFPDNYANFKPFKDKKIVYDIHMYQPLLYSFQGIKGHEDNISYPGIVKTRKTFPTYDKYPKHYWNKETLKSILEPARMFQKKYNIPMYVGEFSTVLWAPGREQYLSDLIDIFNEYKWGWTYFNLGSRWHGFDARYEVGKKKKNGKYELIYMGERAKTMTFLEQYFAKDENETSYNRK